MFSYILFLGALRTEKVELSAQVKKQQARILYFDNLVGKLSKEVRFYRQIVLNLTATALKLS
jgi:hypothetical protein